LQGENRKFSALKFPRLYGFVRLQDRQTDRHDEASSRFAKVWKHAWDTRIQLGLPLKQ